MQLRGRKVDHDAREGEPKEGELTEQDFVEAFKYALRDWSGVAGCTLARVWFDDWTPTFARTQARQAIRGLIDLAETNTSWRLLNGEMTWTPHDWTGTGFSDPNEDEKARRRKPPEIDRTQTQLQQLSPNFIQEWLNGVEHVRRAAEDALWVATLKQTQSYEQRVILAVRALEHAFAQVQVGAEGTWVDAAQRYLRSVLINHILLNELRDTLFCAMNGVERSPILPPGLLERLTKMAFPSAEDDYTWPMLTRDMADVLPQVMAILPEGSMEMRIVRDALETLQSAEAMLARIARVGLWFDRMLARTSRQRNALVHGTGATHCAATWTSASRAESDARVQREPRAERRGAWLMLWILSSGHRCMHATGASNTADEARSRASGGRAGYGLVFGERAPHASALVAKRTAAVTTRQGPRGPDHRAPA